MDYALAALAGLFLTAAIYLLLSRSLIRMLLGLVLLGNAINLVILVAGRLSRLVPPIILGSSEPSGRAACQARFDRAGRVSRATMVASNRAPIAGSVSRVRSVIGTAGSCDTTPCGLAIAPIGVSRPTSL